MALLGTKGQESRDKYVWTTKDKSRGLGVSQQRRPSPTEGNRVTKVERGCHGIAGGILGIIFQKALG